MDNNPGDSSSESDISDPWSLVERDSCDTDEIPGVNCGVDSVCGELSEGDSLEVIDDQHEGEFQETGIETDGVSIVTDSEINEELEQTLPVIVSKEKKYLHHPNTYLNTRLNVLLALTFAAVTGLGVGHFIGLQEECPLLDTSLSQLAKLQQENDILRHKLNQLLREGQSINQKNVDWDYGSESKFRNNGADLHPCLELDIKGLPPQHINENIEPENGAEFGYEQSTVISPGTFFKVIQNNKDVENEINNFDEQKESGINEEKRDVNEDTVLEEYLIPNSDEEDDMVIGLKNFMNKLNSHILSNEEESDQYVRNIKEDSGVEDRIDVEEVESNVVEVRNTYEDMDKHVNLNVDENVINIDSKESDSDLLIMIKEEENFIGTPPRTNNDKLIYPSINKDNMILSEEHVNKIDENEQQSRMYPEHLEDADKEESLLEENDLQIIKSTVELLKVHFDKDILSADTGSVLSSALALAIEHEQSLIHLQNTIIDCKVRNDNFCVKFHKRMKVSASKLKETSERLVDDIDEQMHKLLTKIVRKLNKFKNNVQNKWCHLKNGYGGTNDWLESSVLLDCEKNYKKEYSSKFESYKKSSKIIKNSNKYSEEHQNPGIVIDKAFVTESLSVNNNKQRSDNYDKETRERILQKNWEHGKDYHKKNKKRSESDQHFSQSLKTKFQHTKPEWGRSEKTWNKPETKDDNKKRNMNHEQNVILDHGKTWPTLNVASSKQNNVSGDWILKLADGRAEQRKLNHRSDWVFDRADARKVKREKYQMKDDWYLHRAHGREDCHYNSYSDWYHNKPENGRKLPQTNRWSKKFTHTFANAGKWVKDSFSKFQNRMKFHHR